MFNQGNNWPCSDLLLWFGEENTSFTFSAPRGGRCTHWLNNLFFSLRQPLGNSPSYRTQQKALFRNVRPRHEADPRCAITRGRIEEFDGTTSHVFQVSPPGDSPATVWDSSQFPGREREIWCTTSSAQLQPHPHSERLHPVLCAHRTGWDAPPAPRLQLWTRLDPVWSPRRATEPAPQVT